VIARLAAAALMVSSPAGARAAEGPALRAIEQHRGKVLVLNFWAGWCAPCASEIPLLARIHRDYSARGVQVVGASIDEPESRDAARDLARKLRVNYPVLYGASSAEMSSLELATAIPATAIFDRDGRRAFRLVGEVKEPDLVPRLDWLLSDRATAAPDELVLPPGVTPEHFAQHVAGIEDDEHHQGEGGVSEEAGSAVPT
jgi:thiol-disulfide isomerase/thioredoxin